MQVSTCGIRIWKNNVNTLQYAYFYLEFCDRKNVHIRQWISGETPQSFDFPWIINTKHCILPFQSSQNWRMIFNYLKRVFDLMLKIESYICDHVKDPMWSEKIPHFLQPINFCQLWKDDRQDQNALQYQLLCFISNMAFLEYSLITFIVLVFPSLLSAETGERHVKYEYKYSFKGPHLMNKQGQIPFWTFGGSKLLVYTCRFECYLSWFVVYCLLLGAIPSSDQVRLTPSLRDRKGKAFIL